MKYGRNYEFGQDLTLSLGLLSNNQVFQSLEYDLPLPYLIIACL